MLTTNFLPMLLVVVLTVAFTLLAVALLGVRLLLVKGSSFRGTCAGNSLYLQNEGVVCGVCGRKPGEACGQETAELPAVRQKKPGVA